MVKPIIVGVDIRDLKIAKTGTKTYLEEVCKEFKKGRPDFQFYFFDSPIPVYNGRNKVFKLIEHLRFLLWKQLMLPIMAFSKGCDIVFCTDFFVPCINLNYKTIPVFHDAFFWEYPAHYNKYWLKLFYSFGVWGAKKSAFITTPTDYAKKTVLTFLPVPAEKIITVSEAPKTFTDNTASPSGKLKLKTSYYFLHIGTFEKRKNLTILIEALHSLHLEGFTDYSLILCGQISPKNDMDGSSELLDTIRKHNLEDYVLMPGYVEDNELSSYYSNATLYLFPSINEGFGLPILEAFHNKLPVLVADNTCLPEVGGDAVICFNPYSTADLVSKIKQVINNPQLKQQLIETGISRLQDFSWEKTANELLEIFKKANNRT